MAEDGFVSGRGENWIIAVCCCFCNLTFYGLSRLSGIMLVATTQTFHVSRASAAVPFSLCTAIRNLAGVFVGHLGHTFGVGPVVATGCIFASIGALLCFFAKDMLWLTVCWGGIFGFGFGLSTCLLPLAVNQNFAKHNGMASGISYSGSYIGSFIFPPVVVWLLSYYGLQGTFLIISAGVLHVLVPAMFLSRPNTGGKQAIMNSSADKLCSNPYESNQGVNVISQSEECCEMWKQNINRAFIDSQCNLKSETYKLHLKPVIPQYLLEESLGFRKSSKLEDAPKLTNSPHTETSINHSNLFSNLFKNFKFENTFSNRDYKIADSEESSPTQITSVHVFPLIKDGKLTGCTKCSSSCPKKCAGTVDKEAPMTPKVYLRKLLENRLLSKRKYKAKYKLKLQKLKEVIMTSLSKHKSSGESYAPTGNVTLTSFKYLHSFLCPNSYYISISSKHFYLTLPHSMIDRQLAVIEKNKFSDVISSSVVLRDSKSKEVLHSADASITKKEANILPILNVLLKSNKNSAKSHNGNKAKINYVSLPEEKYSFVYPFQATNSMYDDVHSNRSSIQDDSSSSFKTEYNQSYVPNFSSELSLQGTSKPANRNDPKSNRSKSGKVAKRCFSDWFHMIRQPMFTLIGLTMSIQTFIVVSVVTTIEDFAKDVGIAKHQTHWPLMALSISNLIGTLTLGSISDRGYISRHRFLSLCFFGMSVSLVAVSFVAVSLPSLLSVVAIYGLLESGVIITFPILLKEFVKGERRQAVAIASSNVLSAPSVMLVPMLIGHFRDNIGCYSGLFHLLGATSFTCSLLWLVVPSLCQRRNLKKKAGLPITTKC